MDLEVMRSYERDFAIRVHQSLPRLAPETTAVTGPSCTSVDHTRVSEFCRIGPNANHSRCQGTWCQCPCHDEHEMYGYGYM